MRRWGKEVARGMGAVQILPQSVINTIASVITQTEGASAASNNPGNLMYAGQPGATGTPGHLATFDSLADGQAALANQIQLYASRGMTISDMMNVYAPAGIPGNNPTVYAGYVSSALGVSPDTPLASLTGSPVSSPVSNPLSIDTSDSSDLLSSPVDYVDSLTTQASNFVSGLDFTDPTTIAVTALVGLGLVLALRKL